MSREPEDYEKTYREFWKGIVENPDGTLNVDQLKRELHDYARVMGSVSDVYMHITGGQLSKPNYAADVVIDAADEHYRKRYEDDEGA